MQTASYSSDTFCSRNPSSHAPTSTYAAYFIVGISDCYSLVEGTRSSARSNPWLHTSGHLVCGMYIWQVVWSYGSISIWVVKNSFQRRESYMYCLLRRQTYCHFLECLAVELSHNSPLFPGHSELPTIAWHFQAIHIWVSYQGNLHAVQVKDDDHVSSVSREAKQQFCIHSFACNSIVLKVHLVCMLATGNTMYSLLL